MVTAAPSSTGRNALVVMAVIAAGAALRWMADIITPLLLAVFLTVMVDGFSRVIRRHAPFLPPIAAMALAIVIPSILFAAGVVIVADNADGFLQTLAKSEPKLNAAIADIAHATHFRGPHSVDQMMRRFDPTQYLGVFAQGVQGFASNAVFVLIYLGFLIASRGTFALKVERLFVRTDEREEALRVVLRVRDGIERYLWIQTVTGLIIAIGSWAVMLFVGLDDALFWAFLIFIVNYIPIVGAVAAIALPTLFSLLQFHGFGPALIVLGGLWVITFLVGNILLPRMQGDSLNMDPLVVMLSLAFWGALWGIPGMFLSTPLTVLVMVILAQFDGSRWIAILLSGDGDPQGLGRGSSLSPDETAGPAALSANRNA